MNGTIYAPSATGTVYGVGGTMAGTNGLANAVQGAVRPTQTITWKRDDNTAEDLTGATLITGEYSPIGSSTVTAVAGTLAITDAANGIFTWTYAAADVASAGKFKVQFTAVFPTQTPAKTYASDWEVKESLS